MSSDGDPLGMMPGKDPPTPPLGAPINVPQNTWTWVDFPDSMCDDGTPTGIAVNLSGGKNLAIYMMGGGACWDYLTCAVLMSATHGPFGRAQWEAAGTSVLYGSILDRSQPQNPLRDWNLVFVPYCTADVHAGDNLATYSSGLSKKLERHKGRPNMEAFLKRLAATVQQPDKLVVTGSSAGGFGAALSYHLVRTYFPSARSYLLDDSGPALVGNGIPKGLREQWVSNWRLDKTIDPLCATCGDDVSQVVKALSEKYPGDRMALLSYTQDAVIRSFFGLQSPMQFQQNLYKTAEQLIEPLANFRYYFVTGAGHTFLMSPYSVKAQGVGLIDWIGQLLDDDPNWKSTKP